MFTCGAALLLLLFLTSAGDVRGAAVTSPSVNTAGTSLLLRKLDETPISNQQRTLFSQLGIDQSATGNKVSQPKVAERSKTASLRTTPKPPGGVIYKGHNTLLANHPSPFVERPAPNLAAVIPPPGHRFPNQRPPFSNRGPQFPNQRPQFLEQGPQFPNQRPQFPNQGPQFPNQGSPFPNAAARFPGREHQTPGSEPQVPSANTPFPSVRPQFPSGRPQFPSGRPAVHGSRPPHPAGPLPGPPPPFAASPPSSRAVSPLGSTTSGLGTNRLQGRSSFPPPPLQAQPVLPLEPEYNSVQVRSLPAAAATSRQRRANWRPGHPFQGVPLEGTYLDPLQGQTTPEPVPGRRQTAAEPDTARPRTGQSGLEETRRASRYQRRPRERRRDRYSSPEEVQRDRYSTLHRESFSRQQVEPITDSAEFFSREERDDGGDDGHRHALGENHGYPRDHAARHVYGDGHRAGDPYNIRPTDEQVERGYAREEAHDHYYSRQRYDDLGDEERHRRRRPGQKRKRTRRLRPRQRYDEDAGSTQSRQKYVEDGKKPRVRRPEQKPEYDDYDVDERKERRRGDRQRQQTSPTEYDDYGDYPADYLADYPADYADDDHPGDYTDSEEARASALEDHDDFRPARRPSSRSMTKRRYTTTDTDFHTDDEDYPPSQRRSSSGRDGSRVHYAAENYGRTSRGDREEKERQSAGQERRQTKRESRRLPLAERDGSSEADERTMEVYHRRQRRSVAAQDLNGLGSDISPAFRSLVKAMEKVRKRRQADEKADETAEPLSNSEREYPGNPHNPANIVKVPEVGFNETPVSDSPSAAEQRQQQQQQDQDAEGGRPDSDPREGSIGRSRQEHQAARDPDETLENVTDARPRGTTAEQTDRRPHGDFVRTPADVSDGYQPSAWWESVKRNALTSSSRLGPHSITDSTHTTGKRHQKRDAFGPRDGRAEDENKFASSPSDSTIRKQPSVYVYEDSTPRWGPRDHERSLERRQRHASPSVGVERPSTADSDGHKRHDEDSGDDDSSDYPSSFAQVEPVQTNRLHSEHSKLSGRQRLQQLIGASDDVTGSGGYRDHESLGSRRPGGVPGGHHHDEGRYHGDEERFHGDEQRYHGDERRNGDRRRRPTEDNRRPATTNSGEEVNYPRQPPEGPHHQPEEDNQRYPEDDHAPDNVRRRPDDRHPDGQRLEDDRPTRNPNYYVITPNELASDDVTSYEKPSRQPGGRGQDRDSRPPPPRYHDQPEQEDTQYDDRRPEVDRRPDEDDRKPDEDDRRPEEDDRRNSVYEQRPSDGERGDGGERYYPSRRPQDDGRRYVEDGRRYPEDERRYPDDERRRPDDERLYSEDERRHPDDERRQPEDERRQPEDERRYADDGNAEGDYHGDDRRPSKDNGYHGDDRKPSEDNGYHGNDRPSEDNGYHSDDRKPSEDNGYHSDDSEDSGGRRHLHAEPEERPQFYQEPDTRYPNSAEDAGEGGYYRRPHPEEVEQERLYRRPEHGGRYSSDDQQRKDEDSHQEDSQQSSPQETEEDLYSGPNQGYYDNGAPGYYGNDGPSFTRNHGDDGPSFTGNHGDDGPSFTRNHGDDGPSFTRNHGDSKPSLTRNHGDRRYNSRAERDREANRGDGSAGGDRQPPVTSPVRDDVTGPDQSEADRQVSSFISQMFKEYDPFKRSEQML